MKRWGRFVGLMVLAVAATAAIRLAGRPRVTVAGVTVPCNGYDLSGDLYLPRRVRPPIAILFLHGSTTRGRRLILYPELSARLAHRGFAVLNLDQRGHGESPGPEAVRSVEDLDFVSDAREAARQLPGLIGRPVRAVFVVGHSFGGGVAVAAGFSEPSVAGVVSISPGRRIETRFSEDRHDGIAYVQQRRTRDLGLSEPIPIELIRPMLAAYDIGQFRGTRVPKPLLVIEGDREPRADLAFTRELIASMEGPVEHRLIPGAHHYFGTSSVRREGTRNWEVVHVPTLDRLARAIERWIKASCPAP